jgi:hypothetical protein
MKLGQGPLDAKESLDTYKSAPASVRIVTAATTCALPLFSGKDLTDAQAFIVKGSKWADDNDARFSAEEQARATVIVPLCEATWLLDAAKAVIARERSNPGGVVDLRALHSAGQDVQRAQEIIKSLTPQYVAFRKHAFNGWKTEGACVAAARQP